MPTIHDLSEGYTGVPCTILKTLHQNLIVTKKDDVKKMESYKQNIWNTCIWKSAFIQNILTTSTIQL